MDAPRIYEKLEDVFLDVFGDDSIQLRPDLTADQVEGWDSLSHVRLVLSVQKVFGVRFSAADIAALKNVGGLVQLIQSRQSAS